LDEIFEKQLRNMVKPLLEKGRGGDWEHTLRAVGYGRYLLNHEEGDETIVIPALYLHDIGWSKVDFDKLFHATSPPEKGNPILSLHMKHSAILARDILQTLEYDPTTSRTIVSIIAVHDDPEKAFSIQEPSTTLVVEADRLDRYGPESLKRFAAMFGPDYRERMRRREAIAYLREGLELWFRTNTAKALAEKLARDSDLFN
jgi:HD superfamily phosphodiesterase